MLNALTTYCFIHSLQISAIAFFTTFACYVTVSEGTSSSIICRYILNTSKVSTKLFKLAVSLRALNAIYKAISLLILGSSTTMI